ncbi:hypothetical protein BT96DRAFT_959896 [Gymnopus androsaceus JB14]|uniref:Uncharacterized protein n=1 Tax=Gymnopus androsaceus JB14 TaxID=1447944 RepID=A0A6A4GVT3_9AGAR|nr:hypothetical protein BT96DRAFT_959896 [Gymnopus androsaceus JB14]
MLVVGLMLLIPVNKTGKLTGSEFVDIHDRLRLTFRRSTVKDSSHTAYMIYNTSSHIPNPACAQALVALDFGPGSSLGTVSFSSNICIPMKKYLMKLSARGRTYKFIGSDSQEYFWRWRSQANQEWTCTNASGYLIAYYSLKTPGEPQYEGSSGCSLTIDESFGHLAPELLGSLMIMRHISEYNL